MAQTKKKNRKRRKVRRQYHPGATVNVFFIHNKHIPVIPVAAVEPVVVVAAVAVQSL